MRRALSVVIAATLASACGSSLTPSERPPSLASPFETASSGSPSTTASPGASKHPQDWFRPTRDAPPGLAVIDGADDFGDVLRPDAGAGGTAA